MKSEITVREHGILDTTENQNGITVVVEKIEITNCDPSSISIFLLTLREKKSRMTVQTLSSRKKILTQKILTLCVTKIFIFFY